MKAAYLQRDPGKSWVAGGVSPLALAQERVPRGEHYPWRVLVTCALLNQTQGEQVRPILGRLFARCPHPSDMVVQDLRSMLRPLGLQNRRAYVLRTLSLDCLAGSPPEACYGVGRYALDAYALFVDGRTDVEPEDRWLREYLDWRLAGWPALRWRLATPPAPPMRAWVDEINSR